MNILYQEGKANHNADGLSQQAPDEEIQTGSYKQNKSKSQAVAPS